MTDGQQGQGMQQDGTGQPPYQGATQPQQQAYPQQVPQQQIYPQQVPQQQTQYGQQQWQQGTPQQPSPYPQAGQYPQQAYPQQQYASGLQPGQWYGGQQQVQTPTQQQPYPAQQYPQYPQGYPQQSAYPQYPQQGAYPPQGYPQAGQYPQQGGSSFWAGIAKWMGNGFQGKISPETSAYISLGMGVLGILMLFVNGSTLGIFLASIGASLGGYGAFSRASGCGKAGCVLNLVILGLDFIALLLRLASCAAGA